MSKKSNRSKDVEIIKQRQSEPQESLEFVKKRLIVDGKIAPSYPLRGLPHTYIDPFEPACPSEDWEAESL